MMSRLQHIIETPSHKAATPGPVHTSDGQNTSRFKLLQQQFVLQYERLFDDWNAHRTVVIIPSLSLDQEILSKISGMVYYEERMLCLLMLLRMPRTHVIYVTSVPIDPVIIDYYLHLLPGITSYHAKQRLTMLSCYDGSRKSLTEKILERPRLMQRILNNISANHYTHISCFNMTEKERELAERLNLPVYGCDPDLLPLANKSGSRKLFKKCGLLTPAGFEELRTKTELTEALRSLKERNPQLKRAVVKMEDGFSGEGNAVFNYDGAPSGEKLKAWIARNLQKLQVIASNTSAEMYLQKFTQMGGVVEEFIEGAIKRSPSVQCRINPLGEVEIISTHDQHLGGELGQVFLGAIFPANEAYTVEIGKMGKVVGEALREQGVMGRFGVDFLSVKEGEAWKHYAIEINLRKGGTTHPYLMLEYLTEGHYDYETGRYQTFNHLERFYYSSDNLYQPWYKGLTPHDLIEIAMNNGLQYNPMTQEGVMFHLIGALSQFGKVGVVCIGKSKFSAYRFYRRTVDVLNMETRGY